MGSGASRNNKRADETVRRSVEDQDDSGEEDLEDEIEKKRREIQNRQRLEKAGKLPQLPVNRKIVGLDESDDEAEKREGKRFFGFKRQQNPKTKTSPKEQDDKLNKDLNELEQTLRSLEEDDQKWGISRNRTKKPETHSAFTASNRQPYDDYNGGGYMSASPPTFPRNAPKTSYRSRAGPTPFSASKPTLTKTLKFSWDEQPSLPKDKTSDEWTYKQTVINGFDPDKFRRANLGGVDNNDLRIERRINSPAASTIRVPMSMPGVPTYDQTEKQLLASLEHELGVL